MSGYPSITTLFIRFNWPFADPRFVLTTFWLAKGVINRVGSSNTAGCAVVHREYWSSNQTRSDDAYGVRGHQEGRSICAQSVDGGPSGIQATGRSRLSGRQVKWWRFPIRWYSNACTATLAPIARWLVRFVVWRWSDGANQTNHPRCPNKPPL